MHEGMKKSNISQRVIKRVLHYRNCLMKLQELGFEKVFSYTLGEESGFSAEQIRKDFSFFGIKGNKRGGYDIREILTLMDELFRKNQERKVILIGMGNMGKALAHYRGFAENNIHIVAAFDIDPSKQGKKYNLPVYPLDKMKTIVRKEGIHSAIIAVPGVSSQEICDRLVDLNIKTILNFSPEVLKAPEDVVVNNVNLRNELEVLFFYS